VTKHISILKNKYAGQIGYIIGKGPSIFSLVADDIKNAGPMIVLNEAIVVVEKLALINDIYSQQKDGCGIKTPHHQCSQYMHIPQHATLIIHELESPECMKDYEPRYMFNNEVDFKIKWCRPSAVSALEILSLMGCLHVILISFDSITLGNPESFNLKGDIKQPYDQINPKRHNKVIFDAINKLKLSVEFIGGWYEKI
jgi:hypothetical protein